MNIRKQKKMYALDKSRKASVKRLEGLEEKLQKECKKRPINSKKNGKIKLRIKIEKMKIGIKGLEMELTYKYS